MAQATRPARPGRPDGQRGSRILAIGCLAIVWLAFVFPMFLGRVHFPTDLGETIAVPAGTTPKITSNVVDSDTFFLVYPWHAYLGEQLRAGHFPLWDPSRFLGAPFAADIPAGNFYPPNWLYAFGSVAEVSTLIWAATLAASLAMTFWFLRILRLHPLAAACGAIAWTFGGFMLGWAAFDAFIASAVWLPLALGGLERALHGRPRFGLPVAAAALALSVLGGHAQISLYMWLGAAIWAALTIAGAVWKARAAGAAAARRELLRGVGLTAGAFVLAGGLAAAQILGAEQYASLIVRQKVSYSQATLFRLTLRDLSTLLVPDYHGNPLTRNYPGFTGLYLEATIFAGVLALPLAVGGAVHRNRRLALLFGVLTLVGLLGALGTPVTRLILILPGISRTREVTRLKVLFDFGLAAMAALGLDGLLAGDRVARRIELAGAVLVAGLLVVMTVTRWGSHDTAHYLTPRGLRELAIVAVAIVAIALASRAPARVLAGLAVVALSGLDLWWYGFGFHPFQPARPVYPAGVAEIQALAAPVGPSGPRPRYVQSEGLPIPINSSLVYGLYSLNGYDAFIPNDYVSLINLVDSQMYDYALDNNIPNLPALGSTEPPLLDLLGVDSILTPEQGPAPGELRYTSPVSPYTGRNTVYAEPGAFPPAFLTPCWSVVGDAGALATLQSATDAELAERALVSSDTGSGVGASPACPALPGPLAVTTTRYQAEEVTLSVPASSPGGIVVLSDEFYPGWTATVDGRSAPILRVDEALRGIKVGPGPHTIVYRYQPRWFPDGLAVTALAIAVALLIAVGPRPHRTSPR